MLWSYDKLTVRSSKLDPYYTSIGHCPVTFGPTRAPGDDFFDDLPSKLLHSGKFAKVPFINGGVYATNYLSQPLMNIHSPAR